MPAEGDVSTSTPAVIVVAHGDDVPLTVRDQLPVGAPVIAADSGIDLAHRLGLRVDVAVGDFDSVSASGLDRAAAEGARIERHPEAKDKTDLELALDEARALGARRVVVIGGAGGRLDHLLAGALLLASPRYAELRITAHLGESHLHVVRPAQPCTVEGAAGELVTLLPVGGAAQGVRTEGLVYPLRGEDLAPGTTRGVSNVLLGTTAQISITGGTLLCVLPGVLDEGNQP
jgi:thiamine pyrophosphokinase